MLKKISLVLIVLGLILSLISILIAVALGALRVEFYEEENIVYEKFSVKVRDGASIKGVLYIENSHYAVNNNSVPTVMMLNGINSRKEDNLFKAYQLVRRGFAVFSIEQRGHGESTGPSGFLGKEPYDMVEVLDFIEINYSFANISHLALFAFSYGGGIGAIFQAIEDRVFASVLFHPLTSLDSFLTIFPFQNLIGTTSAITRLEEVKDAFDIANETNTNNLLLIHGTSDTLVFPKSSIDFYSLLNGGNRTDIQLTLRSGLDHVGTETDLFSLKQSIAWFEHFYVNNSIDLSNLETEVRYINLIPFAYPNHNTSENMIIAAAVLLFTGMSLFMIKFKIEPTWERIPGEHSPFSEEISLKKYKKMIVYRSIPYLLIALITGILCSIFNVSFVQGYFILFPLMTIAILIFIPSELHINWKDEWRSWIKYDLLLFFYTLLTIIIPMIFFLIIYNLNAELMFKSIIPVINTSLVLTLLIALSSGIMDYLYLREFKPRHTYLLLILRLLSLLIFILFGVITFYIRQLVLYLSKFYKNSLALYCLLICPLAIFYIDVFFRVV
jgi:alpha/beta superfamily hydrolase